MSGRTAVYALLDRLAGYRGWKLESQEQHGATVLLVWTHDGKLALRGDGLTKGAAAHQVLRKWDDPAYWTAWRERNHGSGVPAGATTPLNEETLE